KVKILLLFFLWLFSFLLSLATLVSLHIRGRRGVITTRLSCWLQVLDENSSSDFGITTGNERRQIKGITVWNRPVLFRLFEHGRLSTFSWTSTFILQDPNFQLGES